MTSGYAVRRPLPPEMKNFLREYWIWILVPIALVAALVAVAWFFFLGEGADPFRYDLF